MTVQDYLNLITSEYAAKPNFVAVLSSDVAPMVQVQALLKSMLAIFDLDTPPVGNQLDIIGQWVGISRDVSIPISGTGIWFSWDDTANSNGWDLGSWQPSNLPTDITTLPDDAYLTLIKAKIAANQWDGTTEGAYKVWNTLFPGITILIQDFNNMNYEVIVLGSLSALNQALLTGGYIQLKPEGVEIISYAIGTVPVFAWDVESTNLQGWDQGNWIVPVV